MAKRIIVAVIFVPILLAVMLLCPPGAWTVLVAFISGAAAYELLRATGQGRIRPSMWVTVILSAVLVPVSCQFRLGTVTVSACAYLVMAVSFWCAIRAYDGEGTPIRFGHVLITLFGGMFIPLGLSALVTLRCMEHGKWLVLLAVLLAFVTDAGAYFAGVLFGRHRGITRVSPNKSVEGYVGGFAVGALFGAGYGLVIHAAIGQQVNYLPLVLCGLLGAAATELGDLAFSFIKRQYGVKDYGHLLPGHGGILDRFDSMIFCAPVVLFILQVLPVFPG